MRRNGEQTKTGAIRDALREAGKPLDLYELWEAVEAKLKTVIGKKKLYILLAIMQNAGEIKSSGRADKRKYALV